ncbi:radical SAM protein [Desulfovibrio inopinatus]|uniref:radical SAM protein n=1 Tax=Desulfovibrio inopinatus TaxID=102109 RepID=UPI0004111DA6|nr:radical SAM protein [Desulfovibrio inopinatus]
MRCFICERGCQISQEGTGLCGRYTNRDDEIVERFPDRYLLACPISVETVPLLHFHPGAPFFQVSTVGCNFDCPGCIATVTAREMNPDSAALQRLTPEAVADKALSDGCRGVAFLLNDPLASYQTFLRVARAAKERGLLVTCASNAYFTNESLRPLLGLLDAINIGFKGLSGERLRSCGGRDGTVVLRNIRMLRENGVHVEVACMERLDNREDTWSLARELAAISPDIPLQLMRFIPLEDADPALEPSIRDTEALARELRSVLPHVYVFNAPGTRQLDTYCPSCGGVTHSRDFYGPMGARLLNSGSLDTRTLSTDCPACGASVSIRGDITPPSLREREFQGGYPFTRGLEIVESMCLAMGVRERAEVISAWEWLLAQKRLPDLHRGIQSIEGYLGLIRDFGTVLGRREGAEDLAAYLDSLVEPVRRGVEDITQRPSVYYAMGKPLFAIMGKRFENHLVETAGGESCNRRLELAGRPGQTISTETLADVAPEVIFISSFIANDPETFCQECCELGLDLPAVRHSRVHIAPIPCSDFGAPKWVLGLRAIANALHPEMFNFDLTADSSAFHHRVYGQDFPLESINRSFAKPSRLWRFEEPRCMREAS